jgi:O-antigen ligase
LLRYLASFLIAAALVAAIIPPGHAAYIGSYAAAVLALVSLLVFGYPERSGFKSLSALAFLVGILCIAVSVAFTYRVEADAFGLVLQLPLLSAIGLSLLGRPAKWFPSGTVFAGICLLASVIALVGGAHEAFILGEARVGLGNNPIHYGSLSVLVGCMALVGISASASPWRYIFLLGPITAIGCVALSGSRGPLLGALGMLIIACPLILFWFWRERTFQIAAVLSAALGAVAISVLSATGKLRAFDIVTGAANVVQMTGSTDDIRAGLYASALEGLERSPIVGHGLSNLMVFAKELFPHLVEVWTLENLHADWANYAVMSGGLGLLAYGLYLLAPLLLLVDPAARKDRVTVLGVTMLTAGQIGLGASNATFGVMPQMMLYTVMLGYFMARSRRITNTT